MSCLSLTSGICRGCRDNAGGIKTVYMTNLQDVVSFSNAKLFSPEEDPTNPGTYIWDNGYEGAYSYWQKLEEEEETWWL